MSGSGNFFSLKLHQPLKLEDWGGNQWPCANYAVCDMYSPPTGWTHSSRFTIRMKKKHLTPHTANTPGSAPCNCSKTDSHGSKRKKISIKATQQNWFLYAGHYSFFLFSLIVLKVLWTLLSQKYGIFMHSHRGHQWYLPGLSLLWIFQSSQNTHWQAAGLQKKKKKTYGYETSEISEPASWC